jgi:hypothetical protein
MATWIRIRIPKADPDPGGPKISKIKEKIKEKRVPKYKKQLI